MTPETAKNNEILRPLSEEEVDELLEIYRVKYGNGNYHYTLMYNQHKWNRQFKTLLAKDESEDRFAKDWISFRKRFYTHRNCDFRIYGTYVSLHKELVQSVSFHSWQPDFKELFECLTQTSLIDWTDGPHLTNVDLPYAEEAKRIALAKGASFHAIRCHGLVLTHENALNLPITELPSGYYLSRLHSSHAKNIHSTWAHRNECSAQYIKGLMKLNKTLGIYRTADNALVAWVFQNEFSGIGILKVLPSEQRKGFGRLLTACLSKEIAESESIPVTAFVVVNNFRSEALFEQIGFTKTIATEWIQLNKASLDVTLNNNLCH